MRPAIEQVLKAVETMGAPGMVKFFPNDALSRELITDELFRMVPTVEALQWLVSTMVRTVGEWPTMKELRALLGTRFTPLDQAQVPTPDCSIPGFTPADSEERYFEQQARESQLKLAAWKREAKLLPPAEQEENRKLLAAVDALAHCPRCQNSGLFESPGSPAPWAWCECAHAARRRKQEPGAVGRANAAVAKLLRLSGARPGPQPLEREVQVA